MRRRRPETLREITSGAKHFVRQYEVAPGAITYFPHDGPIVVRYGMSPGERRRLFDRAVRATLAKFFGPGRRGNVARLEPAFSYEVSTEFARLVAES